MANVLVNDLYLGDIADSIRGKLGVQTTYKPSEMANAIESISGGGSSLGTKSITANGTYNASSDSLDGYSQVTVNVPNTYSAGDEGKVVSNGALVAQTSDTVTSNGTVDTTLINSLLVNVSGGGGSGITKETVEFTMDSTATSKQVAVSGDVTKALFAHFYDKDAVYTTANTTYEGTIGGPALIKTSAIINSGQWNNWRTNSAGSTTGWNNYGTGGGPFAETGYVRIAANPSLISGHSYVLEVFYDAS